MRKSKMSNYYKLPVSVKYLWKLYYTLREKTEIVFEKQFHNGTSYPTWNKSLIFIEGDKLHIVCASFYIGIKSLKNTHKKYNLRPQLLEWFEQVQWTHKKYLEEIQ